MSMSDLAFSYDDLGQKQEALDLREKLFEMRRKTSGEMHPSTLVTMSNLAFSYHSLGQKPKALDLMTRALEMSKRVQGDEHPSTIYYSERFEYYSNNE